MGKWEKGRSSDDYRLVDSSGCIIGIVEDSAGMGDSDEWSGAVCPAGEREEKHLGRFVSVKTAKNAVEAWWKSERTSKDKKEAADAAHVD